MTGKLVNSFSKFSRTCRNPKIVALHFFTAFVKYVEGALEISHLVCKEDSRDCLMDSPWWSLARSWMVRSCPKNMIKKKKKDGNEKNKQTNKKTKMKP